ncbi:protein ROLLING AND ERECT LEAF 2 [Sesamum alatum]|uniref:Protein ROLLING AND ERECT LEAF 2 n=1 Tax=Sesamum alatum TaxID=300844 RepID=A0AAE1YPA1_9LAMI|nr:protein ROLLING AND ERECT LEAF 2 [Sesamum alatum]
MGCSGSKAEDLPLVIRCRQRRDLIRAAARHRYHLAAAHVSYFRSLKHVGDALRKLVDEEVITTSASSCSSVSSPNLVGSKMISKNAGEPMNLHDDEDEEQESHLHLSDTSSSDDDDDDGDPEGDYKYQHHAHDSDDSMHDQHHSHRPLVHKEKGFHNRVKDFQNEEESSSRYMGDGLMNSTYIYPFYPLSPRSYEEPYMDQGNLQGMWRPWYYSNSSNVNYMRKSAQAMKTVVQEPPAQPAHGYSDSYWNSPTGYGHRHCPLGPETVNLGNSDGVKVSRGKETPPPPSPKASAWDFVNPFNVFDSGYTGYYSTGRCGYGSNFSSPGSSYVREMEGIPDLEEESGNEAYKEARKGKRTSAEAKQDSGESTRRGSKAVPVHESSGSSSRSVPLPKKNKGSSRSPPQSNGKPLADQSAKGNMAGSITLTDEKSVDEGSVKKKAAIFEVEGTSKKDAHCSPLSSVTVLPPHARRDLCEVVAEIRDDFEIASSYGKEVAVMLEVGKLPYQPCFLKAILSQILYLISPSLTLRDSRSTQYVKLASRTMKLTKSYFGDVGEDVNVKIYSLSSTLEKLCAWEKKLYKEVKDEERLRVVYEKLCKRLNILDEEGAEPRKIDATQASIRRLRTKLDVRIKAINIISSRIHKLRDDELQPKVAALIYGLIRMWKAMLKCHRKQFQAITESKMRKLKVNTGLQADSSSRAAGELEKELRAWCHHFKDWIGFQKSYIESLNGWLLHCLQFEPEETPDGPAPCSSPSQLGAPPIFIVCNDWHQAMEAISEGRVVNALNAFAASLHQLWRKQDVEGHQRLKPEYLSKDHEKLLRTHLVERGKLERKQDAMSDLDGLSVVPSDSGVFRLDDQKSNLESLKPSLAEERIKHKGAMKLVGDAAASSLLRGLVPMFKALENFTSEALKAHEHVRIQYPLQSL